MNPILLVIGVFTLSLIGLGQVYSNTPFLIGMGRWIRVLDALLIELGVEGFCELWRQERILRELRSSDKIVILRGAL